MRALSMLVPLALVLAAAGWIRPDRRLRGAALLSLVGACVGIAALHTLAVTAGWWTIADGAGYALGLPVDLWLGWSLLWGPLFVLVRVPLPAAGGLLLLVDALVMPRLSPLVELHPGWLVGDALGVLVVALPAIAVGRWCAGQRHLTARAALQFVIFAGLVGWLLPSLAVASGDGSWRHLTGLSPLAASLAAQAALLCALPGLLALREFVSRGAGTPYPWDPPGRLVVTGPYAYVANPMQCSGVALLVLAALLLRSWTLAGAAVSALAFSAGVAGPHEHDDLSRRHGAAWTAYRRQVRAWLPRWRPYLPVPAQLHVDVACELCTSTAQALRRLDPDGLQLRPAGRGLTRARYEADDGYRVDGVAALARGLEHVNLAWAVVGWLLRLPLLDRAVQALVDGIGGGPRAVRGDAGGEEGAWRSYPMTRSPNRVSGQTPGSG